MLDEPKMTTKGVALAAAMCARPLSLPTKSDAPESKAVTSGKDKAVQTVTGARDSACN